MLGWLGIPPVALGSHSRGAHRLTFCSLVGFAGVWLSVCLPRDAVHGAKCVGSLPPKDNLDFTRSLIQTQNLRHDEPFLTRIREKREQDHSGCWDFHPFPLAEDTVGS